MNFKITVIAISIIFVLFSFGYSQEVSAHHQEAYSLDRGAVQPFERWMATISSDRLLTELSIPGTHDTMSDCMALDSVPSTLVSKVCDGRLDVGVDDGIIENLVNSVVDVFERGITEMVTITQTMTLEAQLESGIRALDIRVAYRSFDLESDCRRIVGTPEPPCIFAIYHGDQFQGAFFDDDVLDVVLDFLNQHPTETILMNLQEEIPSPGLDLAMQALLKSHVDSGRIINGLECSNISEGSLGIKLGDGFMECDARGKLVIFSSGWGSDSGTYSTIGRKDSGNLAPNSQDQDFFDVKTMDRLHDEKWEKIEAHITTTSTFTEDKFSFNSLSGTVPGDTDKFIEALATPIGATIAFPFKIASGHDTGGEGDENEWSGITSSIAGDLDTYPDFPRDECKPAIPATPEIIIPAFCSIPGVSLADCPSFAIVEERRIPATPGIPASCLIDYEGTNIMTETCLTGGDLEEDTQAPGYPDKVCSNTSQFNGRLGIVQADFPGKDLINAIIKTNDKDCFLSDRDFDSDGIPNDCDNDDDNDGIADNVDTLPEEFSDDFEDITNFGGETEGIIIDRGDQDIFVIEDDDPDDGVKIAAFSFGDDTLMVTADDLVEGQQVKVAVEESDDPATVSVCGNSALLRLTLKDTTIVTCSSVTIEALRGDIDAEFKVVCRTHTAILTPGQILTFDPLSFKYTNTGNSTIFINVPKLIDLEIGETKSLRASCGGQTHEPPTIGKNKAGTKQLVENGFCIDADCFTVTKLFHEEFKLYEMMSGTHTLSTLVYCAQGVEHCNYSAIGIMPYDKDMNDAVWKIEMKGNHLGEWTPVIYDPEGFLGEVTITTQIISDKFLSVSYTIEFKNKQTPPMKVGVQVRDDKNGVRNFYFNEGVKFNDSDAYPYVETSFEQSIEVKPLCINPQPHDRDSCGFDLVQDWTQKNAQDILNDMLNGNYIHDKYVRDRYYD